MKKLVFRIVGSVTIVFFIVAAIFYQFGYQLNLTASYPMGLYKLYDDSKNIKRNDMVLFCPPDNKQFKRAKEVGYLRSGVCPGNYIKMMKKAAGIPGDNININKYVYINGSKLTNSTLFRKDSKGNLLPKIEEHIKLKDDEYFLMSDYSSKSFDSRYFGAINKNQIIGKMKAIIIF